MARARRLNLAAIEASLRAVQADFGAINRTLSAPRDTLSDKVLSRMMLGYRRVDALLDAERDPFALGNSRHLLELNLLVLCGTDPVTRKECQKLIKSTEDRFYANEDGGIGSLTNWVRAMNGESVWRRAASAYVHVLSQPQLFIEGNHRTGALLMSWMLASEGKPPFVLSVDNAKAYFDPSTLAKNARKHTLKMLVERPKLVRRLADLLKEEAEKMHVLP
jgi:hypothetical protein